MPTVAYIGLGANLGERERNIRDAVRRLNDADGVEVLRLSSLLENPAVGGPPDSPPYLNAVAEVRTSLPPHQLLQTLLELERLQGRVRRQKWEPRPIDLDLLHYGDAVLDEPHLKLPHPRMHERRFVLQPLAELAPDLVHPTLNKTIRQMLAELPAG